MNEQQAQNIVDNLTEKQKGELQAYLKRGKDYLWIAKRLKVSAIAVRNFDILRNEKHTVSTDGYGKYVLRPFIISRRYIDADWPAMDDLVVQRTRQEHDDGKVDMITGRDGFYQLLYRIPRVVIATNRKPYFTKKDNEDESN